MQVRRRHCWVEEDRPQPLMPCSDPLWLVEAPLALSELTGVDVHQIPGSQISIFVVPIAEDDWPERGLRRWEGTRPEAMWHPLLWLPERLAAPLVAVTDDNAVEEPLELWQARVAFEITDSQLYTDDGWIDVLALAGLDVDNIADVDRVRRWLDGAPDPSLDAISLEPFFVDDPMAASALGREGGVGGGWAGAFAAETVGLLMGASKALMADSLLVLAYDLTDPDVDLDDNAYARGAWWLTSLATEAVAEGPEVDAWMTVLDAVQAADQERDQVAQAIRPTLRMLTASRDASWPALIELQRVVAERSQERDAVPAQHQTVRTEPPANGGIDGRFGSAISPATAPSDSQAGATAAAGPQPATGRSPIQPGRRPQARW